jgi:5-methylcytosine-specific restriction endonuclease McrA
MDLYPDWRAWRRAKPKKPEYDHIVPFSEGGLTVLENMRTLCRPCHKARTA